MGTMLILDFEPNYCLYKCLISEMIHIKAQTNGLNCNEDSELLGDSYYNLLEILITIFKYPLFTLSVYII